MVVKSLLGDLIAQSTQKQPPPGRTKNNTKRPLEESSAPSPPVDHHQGPPRQKPILKRQRPNTRANSNNNNNNNRTTTAASPVKVEQELLPHEDDRKPAAKRKRRVNFQAENAHDSVGNKDDDDDDDSLYGDDSDHDNNGNNGDNKSYGTSSTKASPSNGTRAAAAATPEDEHHDESSSDFQEHYSKAFQVIYGPTTQPINVPAVASAASASPTTDNAAPIIVHPPPPTNSYLQTLQETLVPAVPLAVHISTSRERKKPRLVRLRNPKTHQLEMVPETPEQAQQRFHQHERKLERIHITARWKLRATDLRGETDVGGAIYERAKRNLREKVRRELRDQKERERERKRRELEKQQRLSQNNNNENEDEDSVQEQQDVLDRLTQQSIDENGTGDDGHSRSTFDDTTTKSAGTSTNYTSADETFDNWTEGDASVSYRERLDYWEYGYTTPFRKDLEFYHNAPDLRPRLLRGKQLEDPDEEDNGAGLRLPNSQSVIHSYQEENSNWESSYFPSTQLSRSPRFFQYRLLQAMAARHLGGGSLGQDEKLENRLIRLLFSPTQYEGQDLAKFTPTRTLLRLSHHLGCNALIFAKNTWSDPVKAAEELGLVQKNVMTDHHILAGRLQHPEALVWSLKRRRKMVLRKYKLKSRPWIHEQGARVETNPTTTIAPTDDESSPQSVAMTTTETTKATEMEGDRKAQEAQTTGEQRDESSAGVKKSHENDIAQGLPAHETIPTEEERGENDGNHVEDITQEDDKATYGTSAGGVVIDLQTVQSEPTSGSVNFNEDPTWQIAVKEAMLFPTSIFAHIPGTSPPVPQFPLEITEIVYGPIDRYAKYDHQDTYVHHGHFQLALAALLSRVLRSNDDQQREQAQELIQAILDQYIDIVDNRGYKRQLVQSRGKVRDVPLVQFYLALRTYCSFWANGYPALPQEQIKEEEQESLIKQETNDDDDLYADASEKDSIDTRQVADHLFSFLDSRVQHNGLVRFPQLRVTYAVASICRKLPIGAAKILSRALDEDECPTPLHIMRQTCEYLESRSLIQGGALVDVADLEEESMLAGELEYIFYDAAEMLEAAIKAAPTVVEYHAWRIGALAVCFLLGSGNKIGSGARRYPSGLTRKAYEKVGRDGDFLEHEVRELLPKYEEVASQLSSAIRVVFALAHHQPGARIHLTVASLLEWTQVIALLAGDALETSTKQISSLYHHHTLERFLQEHSQDARRSISENYKTVGFYASELENDPGNLECWRALAKALGPIGISSPSVEDANTHRAECKHCKMLRSPRIMDHGLRENPTTTWWGCGREWWSSSLLQIPDDVIRRRNQSKTEAIMQMLESRYEEVPEVQRDSKDILDPDETTRLSWLPSRQVLRERSMRDPPREDRSASFDQSLPPLTDNTFASASLDASAQGFHSLEGRLPPGLEVHCYKIQIFCHLKGPGHDFVESHIYDPLIRASWDHKAERIKDDSNEFRALLWLCNIGLDIPSMSRLKYPKNLRQPLKKSYANKGGKATRRK